jgi:uncharacterized protein (TIGR01244 family)
MTSAIRKLSTDFAVTGQLLPQDLQEVASLGYATVINNRPDGEGGPDQPSSRQLEQAARAAGLHYLHLPVVGSAITPEQVLGMKQALAAGRGRPILAFCRSGARSTKLFELAQAAG